MVSAAKFARAERELKPARVYGKGATGLNKLMGILTLFCRKETSFSMR